MKKFLCICVLCFFSYIIIFSEEDQKSGILYGPNWGCIVQAPDGWIMDQESLSKYNIFGLFYEKGKLFSNNPPIVYLSSSQLSKASDDSLKEYVDQFVLKYKKQFNKDPEIISTKLQNIGKYYYYYFDYGKQYECILFLRYKDGVHSIIGAVKDKNLISMISKKVEEITLNMKFIDAKIE